ncbi:MAG: ATP-binding cassette domain-containing protein [Candidatus Omnitrophica bacterium]|nr:ATP-binding cassette domain-containing protein [Candidatus Omnitrophota bacterium]
MIQFDNVNKKFPFGNIALKDICLEIEDNEFVFVVGPSGAGKTTLLKLITREILPSSGSIFIDETDISQKNFHQTDKLRQKIGMVFQDFKILNEKNVFENVALALAITRHGSSSIKIAVRQALEAVGLKNKDNFFPLQLSMGELQRVAIARAISGERKLILADEPTGNLDPKTTWDIMKIFKKLEGKKTIIIATHNIDVVNSFKKRVISIKEGKIVKDSRKGGYDL